MRFLQTLFILLISVLLFAQTNPPQGENTLKDYLHDLDEMGRTLSGWKGDQGKLNSWFFGSYAMLVLQNNGSDHTQAYPTLELIIPSLWSDFKYLSPRYLVELAGGALSFGELMSVSQGRSFKSLLTEEKFIIYVAGVSYLRMLEGTIGQALFSQIISESMNTGGDPELITRTLTDNVSKHCGSKLGQQFKLALASGSWMDVEIKKVKKLNDSLEVSIAHNGEWSFPVEVLMISGTGDSTYHSYGLGESTPLRVVDQDYKKIILDPGHFLVEFYRFNNKWPRLKGNIHIQPFAALPDWEFYRITVNPSSWSDWDGEKRYGMKITSGFGLDLWPAYPSDYRHRIALELNSHIPYNSTNSFGARLSLGHPINLKNRFFGHARLHTYDDWQGGSLGLTKYIGKQRFLIQGSALKYQRVNVSFEHDTYLDSLVWQDKQAIDVVKLNYSALTLTNRGDRLYINLSSAIGGGPLGNFSILKSQVDLSGVFWKWLVGGLQFVSGTQELSTPSPYQFTHVFAWQDNLAALPNFRGQSKIDHQTNNYMGLSLSGGYWLSWFQMKLFASSMLYDHTGLKLSAAKPHYASGFGFEHKSFFTAGFYFPVWQSHPLEGEDQWAWRYQWRLTWNL